MPIKHLATQRSIVENGILASARRFLPAAVAIALPVALLSSPALSQEERARQPVISVSGEGEASIAPDMALLQLSVVRDAKTAADALAANSAAMTEVLAAIKADGIAERDIQTSNFSIFPQYRHVEPKDGAGRAPEIVGYEVTNGLTIRVRDLKKLGGLIDQSVKLGVNQGGQITFTNDDPAAALSDARKAAMKEAIAKAQTLTEAAGVKLGKVLEINENSGRPIAQPMMRMAMAKDAAPAPVAAGENSYTVTVNVTFALEQ
jgi:uncharacterized protein